MAGQEVLERFYGDVLHELAEHAVKGGTAVGAAVVLKRVARQYGVVSAERLPLPRLTREERAEIAWANRERS
jgi:hypothetical protein